MIAIYQVMLLIMYLLDFYLLSHFIPVPNPMSRYQSPIKPGEKTWDSERRKNPSRLRKVSRAERLLVSKLNVYLFFSFSFLKISLPSTTTLLQPSTK